MLIFCHQIGQQEVLGKLAIRCERRSIKNLPLVTTIKYNNELIRLKTKGITLNIKLKKLLTKIKEIIDIKIKNDIMYLINYSNGGYLWIKVNLCY